jgi:hypothetical protein
MSKLNTADYGEILDDVYLAYVRVLSPADDAEIAEVFEEFMAPANGMSLETDGAVASDRDVQRPTATTLRTPGRRIFGRAA